MNAAKVNVKPKVEKEAVEDDSPKAAEEAPAKNEKPLEGFEKANSDQAARSINDQITTLVSCILMDLDDNHDRAVILGKLQDVQFKLAEIIPVVTENE